MRRLSTWESSRDVVHGKGLEALVVAIGLALVIRAALGSKFAQPALVT